MKAVSNALSCFKSTGASEESRSDDDSDALGPGDFELRDIRIDDELTVPSPKSPPLREAQPAAAVPRPPATPASLQADLETEMTYWSTKYKKDETFRMKINAYVEFRKQVMELKDQGVSSENPDDDPLEPLYQKLGSMLAEAFGMVDPETNDWTPAVKDAANKGGTEYARPSVKAFMWTQAPTVLKSAANLYTRIFLGDEIASAIRSATNFAYPFVQIPISIWAAQNNGYEQSEAVQLQKRENPEWSPNVESSKIVNEDGTQGELRAMRHVLEDLGQLREVDALIKGRDPIKLEQRRRQLDSQILGAKGKLLGQLKLVTKALKRSQKSGTAPPLNEIEKTILNDKLPLEVRMTELSQVTTGRAALSGLARLEAKRLLRQLKDWNTLENELVDAIEAVEAKKAPYESIAVRQALIDTDFERAKVTRYVMLNVLSNQALVRDVRTAFYLGATATQLALQITEYLTGDQGFPMLSDGVQMVTSLAQMLVYSICYPRATGKDALNKFATQWQIIAMTGTGNLIGIVDPKKLDGTDDEVDPAKLDKMVTGKLSSRLGALGSLLGSDQTVYMQAILGWLVDPRTVDDDEAEKVMYEDKMIPCTYAVLADKFGKLKDKGKDRELAREKEKAARKAFVDTIAAQRPLAPEVKEKIDRILQLYEENAANVDNKGDVSKLLGENSTLPPPTQNVLRGSLEQVADSGEATSENDELDRELFKRAGKIEQRGELPSQAAQKLGQAFAWFAAGTSGSLALKSAFALGVQVLITAGDLTEEGAEKLAGLILAGKILGNTLALAGLVLQLGFNHGYQDFIAKKALLRQNAGGGIGIVNAPPPSLRGSLWQEFMVSLGFEDWKVEEITGYETLVGTPIPKGDWPPHLKFLRRAKLTEAMWDQMFAVNTWLSNFFQDHGTLEGKTGEELEQGIRDNLDAIRELRMNPDGTEPAAEAKPEDSDSDDVRIHIEDREPANGVPILNLGQVGGVGNAEPAPEDVQRKPLSPRSTAVRIDALKTTAKRRAEQRVPLGQTGESRIDHIVIPDPDRLWRVDDVREEAERDDRADLLPARINKRSELMKSLEWVRSPLGVHVAQTGGGRVFYLSPNPLQHASPIQAFSIPDEHGQGLLRISNNKYPSLAVCNMLQASLSNNRNLGTLSTEDEFASFSYQHLPYGPTRLAEMPMQDLAAFTQHMALNDPEAQWIPMTTATVRYAPNAVGKIQSVGMPPPVLQKEKSFGVSYEAQDELGATIRGSVMLSFDGQQYSIIDPRTNRPVDSYLDDPTAALTWFMSEICAEHPNFEDSMTFTVLYHVPSAHQSNNDYRSRIAEAGGRASVLLDNWLQRTGSIPEARIQVAEACESFEAQNSYLLTIGAELAVGDRRSIATQVKANRDAIELLARVYSRMTKMAMEQMERDLADN